MRLWRMMIDKVVIDDKGLSEQCFLALKDTRTRCHTMFELGLIDLQEIPKTADRAANRTVFVWRATLAKASKTIAVLVRDVLVKGKFTSMSE